VPTEKKPRVLWLTNLPAPYRFPIWEHLTETLDTKVVFLLKERNWRNWTVPENVNFKHEYLALNSVKIGEFDFIPSIRGSKKLLQNVDLLFIGGWETPFYIRILLLAKRKKIPVIQFYESTGDSHRFNNLLIRKIRSAIFSQADFIVTAGTASSKAVEAMGIPSEKIVTLFNPVDVAWFHSFAQNHRIPQSLGHRYIYVGQLIERKNVAAVIQAFASIRADEDTLTIAGDGPLGEYLKSIVASLNIGKSVNFVGHKSQEELAALYAASNTFILASTNEVWGLVVNEAMASGLHVIVSDKCGVAAFVKDMSGTYICSVDQESIQEAMKRSALDWKGYIQESEILGFTPEKFADGVISTVNDAINLATNPDFIWLTNIPTPYRLSTWKVMDSRIRFELLFLNDSERGREWDLSNALQGLKFGSLQEKALYPSNSIPIYFNFFKPIKRLHKLRAKAIYIDGWESPAFFVTALYAKRIDMKVIYGYRSTLDSHRFNNLLIRKIRSAIFSQADFIVTAGTASSKAVEAMGIPSEKIVTLFNPVDVAWFHSFAQNHRIPQSLGHRYIYVGQLIERKNVAAVIQAFASIRADEDTLTIAGDGPLGEYLKSIVASLNIGKSVNFVGHKSQEELAALYAASNTFILASTNEVWGLVVNEAMASGLHVIVSDKCGVAAFVKDMSGTYICSVDQESIQEAMKRSALDWKGYIQESEILGFTPEKFADGVIKTVSESSHVKMQSTPQIDSDKARK